MPDEDCKHGLAPGTCSLCLHPGAHRVRPVGEVTARIESRFSSHCPRCGRRIEEGESIGLADGDWLCSTCID